MFPSVFKLNLDRTSTFIFYAAKEKRNIDEIKTSILEKRNNIPFISSCSNEDKLTLRIVFNNVYEKIEECDSYNNIIFTDDLVPLGQIIGLYAFYPFKIN